MRTKIDLKNNKATTRLEMKRDKWKRKKKWNIGKTPPHIIHHEPPHLVAIIKKIQETW
jgi:hypothetical protein